MPFIRTETNLPIPAEKEKALARRFGQDIALLPGKSESYLMLSFRENAPLYFAGSDAPAAFCEVKVFGPLSSPACSRLTAALTESLQAELEIPANRIYIAYFSTGEWGWNGSNL
jgi:hypothetical protein